LTRISAPIVSLAIAASAAAQFAAQQDAEAPPTKAQLQAHDDEFVATARKTLEERLRFKLDFVRRAVGPSAERDAAIRQAGQRLVSARLNEIEEWVRATHQLSPSILSLAGSSNRAMENEFEQAVRSALGAEVAAMYEAERRAADERLALARFRNWVAAIDKKLLLSAEQREDLLRLLTEHWRHHGGRPMQFSAVFYGDMLLFLGTSGHSATLPSMPDSAWTTILHAVQCAVWVESQQQPRLAAQARAVRQAAAREILEEHADDEPDDERHEQLAKARRDADRKLKVQRLHDQLRGGSCVGTARPAMLLALRLDDIHAAASLSDTQRRKLELAGMVDIERYETRVAETLMKQVEVQIDQGGRMRLAPDEMLLLRTPSAAITDEQSAFRKLLAKTLSPDQVRKVAEVERARQAFADEAACECVVALVAERLPLTQAEWDHFSERLMEHREALGDISIDAHDIAAKLPFELVRPLFDDDQWELVAPLFGPASADELP
jgi:hypothetical protein